MYALFDDVLLLAEGHIIFYGPREGVMQFFQSQGFHLPGGRAPLPSGPAILHLPDPAPIAPPRAQAWTLASWTGSGLRTAHHQA